MTYGEQEAEESPVLPPSHLGATTADQPARTGEAGAPEPVSPGALRADALADVLAALASLGGKVDDLAAATAELGRLRTRDTDLISRLHDDVTKLRSGEIAAALNPVVSGMIKLHDQMVSLGAMSDPASPVGMLFTQLLQTMELTCGVTPFTPEPGERFDASRHTGTRRIPTTDASADGTIAGTIKAGFARSDGSVVRVAEVEVHQLSA
jgi:molecular chaperone GrpE (heat shock protein)